MIRQERQTLTKTQDRILKKLVLFTEKYHYQPSLQELADMCNKTTIQRLIDKLAAHGWIEITGKPRAIGIPDDVYNGIVAEAKKRKKKR
jgi:SOS-response transcriptional repressor LexA